MKNVSALIMPVRMHTNKQIYKQSEYGFHHELEKLKSLFSGQS